MAIWIYVGVGATVAAFGAGLYFGEQHVQVQWDKEKLATAAKIEQLQTKAAQVNTVVETKYIDRVVTVQEAAKTIIRKVPVYVTQVDDSRCTINNGFIRLWDSANSGVPLPDAASALDAEASRVRLSDVAAEHAREAEYARSADAKVSALQDWITQQQAAAAAK